MRSGSVMAVASRRMAVQEQLTEVAAQIAALTPNARAEFEAETRTAVKCFYRDGGSSSKTFLADTKTVVDLPPEVQRLLLEYRLPRGTAVELARVRQVLDPRHVLVAVIANRLSFRETARLVRLHRWWVRHQPLPEALPDALAVSRERLLKKHSQLPDYPSLGFLATLGVAAPEPAPVATA